MSNKDLGPLQILAKFGSFFKKNDSKISETVYFESKILHNIFFYVS